MNLTKEGLANVLQRVAEREEQMRYRTVEVNGVAMRVERADAVYLALREISEDLRRDG